MAERSIAAPESAEVARLRRGFHGGRARSLSLSIIPAWPAAKARIQNR
jgi:hypothetical protein